MFVGVTWPDVWTQSWIPLRLPWFTSRQTPTNPATIRMRRKVTFPRASKLFARIPIFTSLQCSSDTATTIQHAMNFVSHWLGCSVVVGIMNLPKLMALPMEVEKLMKAQPKEHANRSGGRGKILDICSNNQPWSMQTFRRQVLTQRNSPPLKGHARPYSR